MSGTAVWSFIPWELQPFFAMVFDQARSSGEVWRHTYDCSSPKLHRICEMSVHPSVQAERISNYQFRPHSGTAPTRLGS